MGAWGVHAFENDEALDWNVGDDPDLAEVERALDEVIGTPRTAYLETTEGHIGWAAAELVAVHHGKKGSQSPLKDSFVTRIKNLFGLNKPRQPRPDLVVKALAVLDRLLAQNSELRELWEESSDPTEWLTSMGELRARLLEIEAELGSD